MVGLGQRRHEVEADAEAGPVVPAVHIALEYLASLVVGHAYSRIFHRYVELLAVGSRAQGDAPSARSILHCVLQQFVDNLVDESPVYVNHALPCLRHEAERQPAVGRRVVERVGNGPEEGHDVGLFE